MIFKHKWFAGLRVRQMTKAWRRTNSEGPGLDVGKNESMVEALLEIRVCKCARKEDGNLGK